MPEVKQSEWLKGGQNCEWYNSMSKIFGVEIDCQKSGREMAIDCLTFYKNQGDIKSVERVEKFISLMDNISDEVSPKARKLPMSELIKHLVWNPEF